MGASAATNTGASAVIDAGASASSLTGAAGDACASGDAHASGAGMSRFKTQPGKPSVAGDAVGSLIGGRYLLLFVVGRGGMSVVYAARDMTLNKLWAVKHCRPRDDEPSALAAFRAEAAFIKRFDHPCIPRIVDFVENSLGLFVVMDYVEGVTLRTIIIDSGRQPASTVVEWALQLCDVLEYLHGRKTPVVHRDIKPGNIMITPEGKVRLIDFGIAHERSGAPERGRGTPGFSAPEQFAVDDAVDGIADGTVDGVVDGAAAECNRGSVRSCCSTDPRVDVYALGATMYAALTARHPRRGVDWDGVACDRALRQVVERCMEDDPAKRFASCAHVAYALKHCDDGAFQASVRRRWRGFVATVLAAAVALGASPCFAAAAWYVRNNDYSHWMTVAGLCADARQSWQAYRYAIHASPTHTKPYEEMIRLAKADGVFDSREESELCDELTAHAAELESQADGWGRLCYGMGVLYWYYADADDACGTDETTDSCWAKPRNHAMASASSWMRQAVDAGGFEELDSAQVYADMADFSVQIVQRANEGTDKGLYAAYFSNLERMAGAAADDANPVVSLSAAWQIVVALQVYPRHFRYDAITLERMRALESQAMQLALRTEAIGRKQADMKARILHAADDSQAAMEQAFSDPGAGMDGAGMDGAGMDAKSEQGRDRHGEESVTEPSAEMATALR